MPDSAHPLTAAGLGLAPFRPACIQAWLDFTGGSLAAFAVCNLCSAQITYPHCFQSADGRVFMLGCECALQVDDPTIRRAVQASERERSAAKRASKAAAVAAELSAMLEDASIRARLAGMPHPQQHRAVRGESMLDSATWLAEHAGATGRAKLLRALRAALA